MDEPITKLPEFYPNLIPFALSLTKKHKQDAEDLVQATFLRAVQNWKKYQQNTNLCAWLKKMMFNIYLNQILSRNAHKPYGPDKSYEIFCEGNIIFGKTDTHVNLYRKQLRTLIRKIINAVSDNFRPVLAQYADDHITGIESYARTSQVCEIPIGTIKSQLNRARNQIFADSKLVEEYNLLK